MGTQYEEIASEYLRTLGYEILEKNFRCRLGEIDIVAKEQNYLCFIEVKYRKTAGKGHPEEAVDRRKQNRICRVADYYLLSHAGDENVEVRFDVVAILGKEITLYRNAFVYQIR